MRKTRLCGLLWVFIVELQAAVKSNEEKVTLTEGQTLNVECPFNIIYTRSRKAWQRLTDGGERRTLAIVGGASEPTNKVQEGKYFLKQVPSDGMLYIRMTNVQVADSGLYECVIYQPPKAPDTLFYPVRLTVMKDPASEKNPNKNPAQVPTLPPITTKAQRTPRTSPRIVTQRLPMSTASLSSPGLTVNPTQGTDIIRLSRMSIIIIVVCGILSKSLVFTALLFVTQRYWGS